MCFETCSINGTILNYSVKHCLFSYFSFFHFLYLCTFLFPVHLFFFFFWFPFSAICFHILTTSKKCLTSILVSILTSLVLVLLVSTRLGIIMVREYQVSVVKFIVPITHVIVVFSLYRCSLLLFINIM